MAKANGPMRRRMQMRWTSFTRVLGATFLFALAVTVYGQTATVQGRITDQTGAVVPQARVTATNVSSGVNVSTVTNEQGAYNVPFLQPGTYTIAVEKQGFRPA